MIELGWLLPDGTEIDLSNSNSYGSVHTDYAVKYIIELKENNIVQYNKFIRFYEMKNFGNPSCHSNFLMYVLGWIKIGRYSKPCKVITYACVWELDEETDIKRMEIIKSMVDIGYYEICLGMGPDLRVT